MSNNVNNDWEIDIQTLLNNTRIAFLSTQGDKSPETSMCPYAVFQGNIVLHLSGLAKHSKNLNNSKQAGLMICTPETPQSSSLALPRLSFTGCIEAVPEPEQADYRRVYLQNIPDAESLFSFPDFSLYRVNVKTVFWVGGFGKARQIPLETWKSLC